MALEVRVLCEHPGCKETERASVADEKEDFGSIVLGNDKDPNDHSFMFTLDSGWIDAPEGWVLGADDQVLCPKHAPAEPTA
jgi:hypothetical protein